MHLKTPITRVTKVFGPVVVHVTRVLSPSATRSNLATLLDSNGFRKSRFITTVEG